MLSRQEYNILRIAFHFYYNVTGVGLFDFKCIDRTNTRFHLQLATSRWKWAQTFALGVIATVLVICGIAKLFASFEPPESASNIPGIAIHMVILVAQITVIISCAFYLYHGRQLAIFFNQIITFNFEFGHEYLGQSWSKPNKLRELGLAGFVLSCHGVPFFIMVLFLINPETNQAFLYSSFPSVLQNWFIIFMYCCFLMWFHYYCVALLISLLAIQMIYIFTTKFWLRQFEALRGHAMRCKSKGDRPVNAIIEFYRSLQLLNNFDNLLFAKPLIFPYTIICSFFVVAGGFTAIRCFHHISNPMAYAFFPSTAMCTLFAVLIAYDWMSHLYEHSKLFNQDFINCIAANKAKFGLAVTNYCLAQVRANKCLTSDVGDVYFIQQSTTLVFVNFLVSTTISTIITFK